MRWSENTLQDIEQSILDTSALLYDMGKEVSDIEQNLVEDTREAI